MSMRKTCLALTGALITAFIMPAAYAQEADEISDGAMIEIAEQALGIATPEDPVMTALANLPPPSPGAFAGFEEASSVGMDSANLQLAEGPGGHPGGPDGGPCGHHWGGHGGGMFGVLQGPLAMTDDQYERLYAIKNDSSDAMGPKKLAMHQAMRGLMEALGQSDQDAAKVRGYQTQIASLRSDMSSAETGKLIKMSQVLTGDQRKALRMAMIKGSMHHHGGHHH